jgi:hypothetical protein
MLLNLKGYDPDGADWSPLEQERWVGWRRVKNRKGKWVKMPLSVNGGPGSVTDPKTWGTREQAERCRGDGVGFVLGYVKAEDEYICGIDLDGCLDDDDEVKVGFELAREIIRRFNTYREVSPGGHGVHLMFTAAREDVRALGLTSKGQYSIKPGSGDHDEIALDVSDHYLTITGNHYDGKRPIRRISRANLEWLLSLAKPTSATPQRDNSGSSWGERFFMKWYRKHGDNYEDALREIMAHKGRAGDWARRTTDRELERAWEDGTCKVDAPREVTGGVTFFDAIDEEKVKWLRPSWPRGTVVMLAGDSGVGKSTILYDLIARVSRGLPWPPTEEGSYEPEVVLLLNYEDPKKTIIKPRLRVARADMSKVALINRTTVDGKPRPFLIAEDLPLLEQYIADHKPALVIIDPVSAFMGTRTGRDHSRSGPDVRSTLDPLAELAERTETTIVMVSHFRKSGSGEKGHLNPLHMVVDSQAYTALPRIVWLVAKDPDDKHHRFMLTAKNQYEDERDWLHLGFALIGRDAISRVRWDDEAPEVTIQEVVGHRKERGRPESARIDAKAFLQETLKDGPVPIARIRERAEGYGLNLRTVYYARDDLGVKTRHINGEAYWELGGKK